MGQRADRGMVMLLPDEGRFEAFEAGLDAGRLEETLNRLKHIKLNLNMPKFSYESEFMLSTVLRELGMTSAFDDRQADFSGVGKVRVGIQVEQGKPGDRTRTRGKMRRRDEEAVG